MIKFRNLFDFEKKSVFLVNFFLIILFTFFLYSGFQVKYFFYFNIFLTLFLSYFFFIKSKKLAKYLILTNLFIFFYFLYPEISRFLTDLLGSQSYVFILFYNVLIAFIFLFFSGNQEKFLGDFRKLNLKLLGVIIILGVVGGFLFTFVREPIPNMILLYVKNKGFLKILFFLFGTSFVFAFSEQLIFNGFLFNVYRKLTTIKDARIQVAILFVLFHLLRFEVLVKYYYINFNSYYLFYLSLYYVLLFVFMYLATYFYSFKSHKYSGNFFYPFFFHFITDFSLFLLYGFRF